MQLVAKEKVPAATMDEAIVVGRLPVAGVQVSSGNFRNSFPSAPMANL